MNGFNLYPYNMFILLGAVAALFIVIFLTFKRLRALSNALTATQKHAEAISKGLISAGIKQETAQEAFQKPIRTFKTCMKLFSWAMALRTGSRMMRNVAEQTYEEKKKKK